MARRSTPDCWSDDGGGGGGCGGGRGRVRGVRGGEASVELERARVSGFG
jgi:hypothetical protein